MIQGCIEGSIGCIEGYYRGYRSMFIAVRDWHFKTVKETATKKKYHLWMVFFYQPTLVNLSMIYAHTLVVKTKIIYTLCIS